MKDWDAPNAVTDQLVASQWFDRMAPSSADVPERRLIVAVLVDAVRCLQGGERERTEAMAWIRQGYGPARLSFGMMCEALDLDPEPLARRLLSTAVTKASLRVRRTRGARKVRIAAAPVRRPPRSVDSRPTPVLSQPITA